MSVKTNVEEMLVERGIITRQQLERVRTIQLDHRDKSLTDIMLLLGYTTEEGILKCFSEAEENDVVCWMKRRQIRLHWLCFLRLLSGEITFFLYVLKKGYW